MAAVSDSHDDDDDCGYMLYSMYVFLRLSPFASPLPLMKGLGLRETATARLTTSVTTATNKRGKGLLYLSIHLCVASTGVRSFHTFSCGVFTGYRLYVRQSWFLIQYPPGSSGPRPFSRHSLPFPHLLLDPRVQVLCWLLPLVTLKSVGHERWNISTPRDQVSSTFTFCLRETA